MSAKGSRIKCKVWKQIISESQLSKWRSSKDSNKIIKLDCGHYYHTKWLDLWINENEKYDSKRVGPILRNVALNNYNKLSTQDQTEKENFNFINITTQGNTEICIACSR